VISKIRTKSRIVLTGTPMQNNLVEYHQMVDFIAPNLLGTKKEFMNMFANPIMNGQHKDSKEHDVRVMKRRSHVLHEMLSGVVQRKDIDVLKEHLPPKHEYVIFCRLSEVQCRMYNHYLTTFYEAKGSEDRMLFNDFNNLTWLCAHPMALQIRHERHLQDSKEATSDEEEDNDENKDRMTRKDFECMTLKQLREYIVSKGGSYAGCFEKRDLVETAEKCTEKENSKFSKSWYQEIKPDNENLWTDHANSAKIMIMLSILEKCQQNKEKIVIFSQSRVILDLVEKVFKKVLKSDGKPKWRHGINYYRLDGSTPLRDRSHYVNRFNNGDKIKIMLVSTKAGGIGINLYGANRAIMFDTCWNPAHDKQAIFRIYRIGQVKHCVIYRLVAKGTMENVVYERQISKQGIAQRVVEDKQVNRHFNSNDLKKLYEFNPHTYNINGREKVSDVLKGEDEKVHDSLFRDLLKEEKFRGYVSSYLEENTLLKHQVHLDLSKEEQTKAWEEYKAEAIPEVDSTSLVARFSNDVLKGLIGYGNKEVEKIEKTLSRLELMNYTSVYASVFHHNPDIDHEECKNIAHEYLVQKTVRQQSLHKTKNYIAEKIKEAETWLQKQRTQRYTPIQPHGMHNPQIRFNQFLPNPTAYQQLNNNHFNLNNGRPPYM